MKADAHRSRFALGALLAALFVATTTAAVAPWHFDLAKSAPVDEATVDTLSEVTLWFTEAPSEGSVMVHLIDPAGEPVEDLAALPDENDGKIFHMATPDPLAPGAYTVSWRGMGPDGHVVRGEFGFTVTSH